MRPVLRPFRSADAAAVLDAFDDPEMTRQGDIRDLDGAAAWIGVMAPGHADRHVFAIDLDGTVIGAVGITAIDPRNRTGWFWYWLHRTHRGRGLTSQAAATVANLALGPGRLERLELGHRVNSPASQAVAEAAGFVCEGIERGKFLIAETRVDVLTYGRLITDLVPHTEPLELLEWSSHSPIPVPVTAWSVGAVSPVVPCRSLTSLEHRCKCGPRPLLASTAGGAMIR